MSILLEAVALCCQISVKCHLPGNRCQILIAHKLLLLLVYPTRLGQLICCFDPVSVNLNLAKTNKYCTICSLSIEKLVTASTLYREIKCKNSSQGQCKHLFLKMLSWAISHLFLRAALLLHDL